MRGQRWVLGAVLATLVANAGCVACCHKTYETAWRGGAECDIPVPCRGQVYVFMIHGVTPSTECGLEALRLKLGEAGFCKVGVGELVHCGWVQGEIKRIRKCEPEARFVLVGYDLGGPAAVSVAHDLSLSGVPVEAVVLIAPMGKTVTETCEVRTLLIAGGGSACRTPHTEAIVVPDANHWTLPAHPVTVAVVTGLLREIAVANCHLTSEPILEWSYPHAPPMRPEVVAAPGPWNFLADHHTTPHAIGTREWSQPLGAASGTPVPPAPVATKR
jgi:hypothetical protein